MGQLLDIRKLALIAFLEAILSALYPGGKGLRELFAMAGADREIWWVAFALSAILLLFVALPPTFLFLLYRNRAQLSPTPALRRLALVAAIAFAARETVSVPAWLRSSGSYFDSISTLTWGSGAVAVRAAQSDPRTLELLSNLLGLLFNLSLILILIAFFRTPEDEAAVQTDAAVPFRKVTRIALITGYVALGFCLLRIAYIPFLIDSVRSIGGTPPAVMDLLPEMLNGLLLAACITSVPFIVSKSLPEETVNTD